MITNTIIFIVYYMAIILTSPLSLLGLIDIYVKSFTKFINAATWIGQYMYIWNPLFPVDEIFTVLYLSIALATLFTASRLMFWIIATIRGGGMPNK